MTTFQNIKAVNAQQSPCPRWGHSMICIQNQIFIFGGYQNSKYYNDLFTFDLNTLAFSKANHSGDIPPPCSNFTLNYYPEKNVILLFGGGTLNKEKLNTVYELDVSTLVWRKINFDENASLPWQRSYHCAQIIRDYLIIYGGQFFHDLEDTWILNLKTYVWKQIKPANQTIKPKARKFASSYVYQDKMYIIGGCSGKYQCVADNYEMDFKQFFQTGDEKLLIWKPVQFQSQELLVRWGHISINNGSKTYVFGGRQGNKDLQNLVQIDSNSLTCKTIQLKNMPKGRRKPSMCMKNNIIFCFSGFDGSYVKDFIYFDTLMNLDQIYIKQDTIQKHILMKILTPINAQQQKIRINDQVIYVDNQQYKQIQQYLLNNKKQQTYNFKLQNLQYKIIKQKIINKSQYLSLFLSSSYKNQQFIFYHHNNLKQQEIKILYKMFITYLQFNKVIVQRQQFKNSQKYFTQLLNIAQYYSCHQLTQICKKQILKFFTDQILSYQSNIYYLAQMCDIMTSINQQYQYYAGYYLLKKIVQQNHSCLTSINDLKKLVKNLHNQKWILKMIYQFGFQISQLIIIRNENNLENINSINVSHVPHHEQVLYEKTRKGSMHNKHINI